MLALKKLGYKGELIELNDGNSVLFTVELLAKKLGRQGIFVILMDWDRTGEKLAKKLQKYGESCDLIPNFQIRKNLSSLCSKDIACIEELPTFINMLKISS